MATRTANRYWAQQRSRFIKESNMADLKAGNSWHETQRKLRECETKEQVLYLIEEEVVGENRARWINRMRGRYMVLRVAELDAELDAAIEKMAPVTEEE